MAYFRKDKKAPKRFHGAFHGGFSAGHFNTVGSSSGWVPQNYDSRDTKDNKKSFHQQTIQDFMDDEDEETWGGVVHVQKDYQDRTSLLNSAVQKHQNPKDKSSINFLPVEYLESTFNIKDRVGIKLLKHLGWNFDKVTREANSIVIPSPKLNQNGIDYNPYKDAPEFQKAQEKIRKRAEVRARNATTGGGGSYRASNLLDEDNDEDTGSHLFHKNNHTGMLQTTEEDFIGTKTVSGFSLKDDADDVYDDNDNGALDGSTKFSSQYQTHIYEASDSDDNTSEAKQVNLQGTLDKAFKSWAQNNENNTSTTPKSLMSDGRVPIPGFQLGITDHVEQGTRWPGPDVPSDFKEGAHIFETDEDIIPDSLNFDDNEALSNIHHHNPMQSLSSMNTSYAPIPTSNQKTEKSDEKDSKPTKEPMAGPIFSTLAKSMKDRFVSSSSTKSESSTKNHAQPIGLLQLPSYKSTSSMPENEKHKQHKEKEKHSETKLIAQEMVRTYNSWEPSKLLCKRLNIPVPKPLVINLSNSKSGAKTLNGLNSNEWKPNQSTTTKSSEDVYFQSAIQPLVIANRNGNSKSTQPDSFQLHGNKSNSKETSSNYIYSNENAEDKTSNVIPKRPPIDIFKSIFESNSESDSSSCSSIEDRKDDLKNPPPHLFDKKKTEELQNINTDKDKGHIDESMEKPIHKYIPKINRTKASNINRINVKNNGELSIVQIDSRRSNGGGSKSGDEYSSSTSRKKRHKRSTKSKRKHYHRKRRKRSNRNSLADNEITSESEDEDETRRRRRKKHKRRRHPDDYRRERRSRRTTF